MIENVAFLRRLRQIVSEAASREERNDQALALFNSYRKRLYSQLGIGPSNRPTGTAKAYVDRVLADLRLKVLEAEVWAVDSSAAVFTTVRHRIEMARRALAIRIVEDGVPRSHTVRVQKSPRTVECRDLPSPIASRDAAEAALFHHARTNSCDVTNDGHREAVHQRLLDRQRLLLTWQTIQQSRELLARLGEVRLH
jgi:hypothetical protein